MQHCIISIFLIGKLIYLLLLYKKLFFDDRSVSGKPRSPSQTFKRGGPSGNDRQISSNAFLTVGQSSFSRQNGIADSQSFQLEHSKSFIATQVRKYFCI